MIRLLEQNDSGELLFSEFEGQGNIPAYAILSHTWSERAERDELIYKDVLDGVGREKLGYQKVQSCLQQAHRDGLRYCWIDTCCIDKANITELTEAITSMFRWYQNSAKCYTYLCDVPDDGLLCGSRYADETSETAFMQSRWFTRGWTLQELLAPASVEFFSSQWTLLGSKVSLQHFISETTGIPDRAIQGHPLTDFSIEDRFSWAISRQTKREEDRAYCLLGIFDVSMSLIYGEGEKSAQDRLKRKIEKSLRRSSSNMVPVRRAGVFINEKGNTALSIAAGTGCESTVKFILDNGENANVWGKARDMALVAAARQGHKSVTKILLANGVSADARDAVGDTALIAAARQGHEGVTKILLANGVSADARDAVGDAPLVVAAKNDHVSVVKLLLDSIARVEFGAWQTVKVLLDHGADASVAALAIALGGGHVCTVKMLLQRGADVDAITGDRGLKALHAAVGSNHLELVEFLIVKGVDVNGLLQFDRKMVAECLTTLSNLTFSRNQKGCEMAIINELLLRGANVDYMLTTGYTVGYTALHVASIAWYFDSTEMVDLLIRKGAYVDAKGPLGVTALSIACSQVAGTYGVAQSLINHGAEIDAVDDRGRTALYIAAQSSRLWSVEILVRSGANVNVRALNGSSALDVATNQRVVEVLKPASAVTYR